MMINKTLKIYASGNMVIFTDPDYGLMQAVPKGAIRIYPFQSPNVGFQFVDIRTMNVIAQIRDWGEVQDSGGSAWGSDYQDTLEKLCLFFDVTTGADTLAVVLASGNNSGAYDIDMNGNDILNVGSITGLTYKQVIQLAVSDETTALTTGTSKIIFRMPFAFTLTAIRASLGVAQTSGSIFTVDVNQSGSSILGTKLTIDNTEKTSVTAATPATIVTSSLTDDAEITIDIDQVGDGTAKGLKVTLIGTI